MMMMIIIIIIIITCATGTISKSLGKYLSNIPGAGIQGTTDNSHIGH